MPDLIGRTFVRWTVLEKCGCNNKQRQWKCRCSCGTIRMVGSGNLLGGGSKSCGCLKRERTIARKTTHGKTGTIEHRIWLSMKVRCRKDKRYIARGTKVCERWQNSFEAFLADMGPRPSSKYSIERKSNDGDYEPGNCCWATKQTRGRNTKSTHWLTHDGVTLCLKDWALKTGINRLTISSRIANGWSIAKTLTTKPRKIKPRKRPASSSTPEDGQSVPSL